MALIHVKKTAHPKRTSIGRGPYSRPTNKHKYRSWKKYVGQGRKH